MRRAVSRPFLRGDRNMILSRAFVAGWCLGRAYFSSPSAQTVAKHMLTVIRNIVSFLETLEKGILENENMLLWIDFFLCKITILKYNNEFEERD